MDRLLDWSAVGWDGDPTPGDPVVVRAGGLHYRDVAAKLRRSAATLRALNGGVSSGSQSVAVLLENSADVASQLDVAGQRYEAAGDALVDYAYALDWAQATTAEALASARSAQWEVEENTRLAGQYHRWALYASAPDEADDKARYERLESDRWSDVTQAQSRIAAQKSVVDAAVADRDAAAQAAVSRIEEITSSDGLNDSWWDDWGADVVGLLTSAAEWVATVTGILALLVCWIPVIGQALAGALLLVAAVASIVAALGNTAVAATGERSWNDAILSLIGAALACVGLRGAVIVGKSAFNATMRTGSGMVNGQRAVGVGRIRERTRVLSSGVGVD